MRFLADEGDKDAVAFFLQANKIRPLAPPPAASTPSVRRDGDLRVGFLSPSLTSPGGAEEWIRALVSCPTPGIHWSGVAVAGDVWDEDFVRKVSKSCPIVIGSDVETFAHNVDVLVSWGIPQPRQRLGTARPYLVSVAHGSCKFTTALLAGAEQWADRRTAVSRAAAEAYPDGSEGVEVLWNGADPRRVFWTDGRDKTREAWRIQPREIAVGYIGRLAWNKNPTAISKACLALGRGYRPVYVGSGGNEDKVRESGYRLTPDAVFPGFVETPGDALEALDVFILASPAEGFSLGLIEAWLSGTPAIATRVGAVPELEEEFGPLVIPVPINPTRSDLAEAVRIALSEEGAELAENARSVAIKHLTQEAMVDRWGDFLRGIRSDSPPDVPGR